MNGFGLPRGGSLIFGRCIFSALMCLMDPSISIAAITIESQETQQRMATRTPQVSTSTPEKTKKDTTENTKKALIGPRTSDASIRITSIGFPSGNLSEISGMGRDVLLSDALQQVLPRGWKAYAEGDVDSNDRLNWRGGGSWPSVLNGIFESLDLMAEINWNTKEITIWPSNAYESQASRSEKIEKLSAIERLSDEAAKKDAAENLWELIPGKSLSENLRSWSERAGWRMVWSARVDYPIDAPVQFTGKISGKDGALARVIGGYADAEFPLEVEFFYENKVVEVRLHRMRLN